MCVWETDTPIVCYTDILCIIYVWPYIYWLLVATMSVTRVICIYTSHMCSQLILRNIYGSLTMCVCDIYTWEKVSMWVYNIWDTYAQQKYSFIHTCMYVCIKQCVCVYIKYIWYVWVGELQYCYNVCTKVYIMRSTIYKLCISVILPMCDMRKILLFGWSQWIAVIRWELLFKL